MAWPVLLLLICGFADAQAQREPGDGNEQQPDIVLPASVINRELTTIHYEKLKLADYPGKIIVVNLFASWCGPCRMNLADLIDLKSNYTTHPIEVIGLVWNKNDPDIERLREFAREQNLNFQVVWYEDDFGELLVKAVNGRSVIPQTFVIDKDGCIRKHFQGYNASQTPALLREALDQVGQQMESTKPGTSP